MDLEKTLQTLKEGLATSASVKAVYGDPITLEGKTIIPVARIGFGFGAGSGGKPGKPEGEEGGGGGGGGGVGAVPVGVVEITRERTRFISFGNRKKMAGAILIGLFLGMMLRRCRR